MNPLDQLQLEFETYTLYDDECFPLLWDFHGKLRATWKYWLLNRSYLEPLVRDAKNDWHEMLHSTDIDDDFIESEEAKVHADLQADEDDFDFIPLLQKSIIIVTCLSLVENLLRDTCQELGKTLKPEEGHSTISTACTLITECTDIQFSTEHLEAFDCFSHLRSAFLHRLDHKIEDANAARVNKLTGPFADITKGLTPVHVDLCLRVLNDFGESFQDQYVNWSMSCK